MKVILNIPYPNFYGLVKLAAFNKTLSAEVEDTEEVLQCSYLEDYEARRSCATCVQWCKDNTMGNHYCGCDCLHIFTSSDFYCKNYKKRDNLQ